MVNDPWAKLRDGLLVIVLLASAVVHARTLSSFAFEDAYITFRYAQNLAAGEGFVFNPGERVLGTSTPLFTLILAAFAWLGLDLPTVGTWLYCLSLALAGGLGAWFLRRQGSPNAGAMFALTTVWATGMALAFMGMETTFHLALILACLLAADYEQPILTGVLLGLLCLNRYDGMVVALVVGLYLWARRRKPPWTEAWIAVILFGCWLAFAQLYFGSFLPNTLGAKAGDSEILAYLQAVLRGAWNRMFSPLGDLGWSLKQPWKSLFTAVFLLPFLTLQPWVVRRRPALWMAAGFALLLGVAYGVIGPPTQHQWYHLPGLYGLLLAAFGGWGVLTQTVAERLSPTGRRHLRQGLTLCTIGLIVMSLLYLGPAGQRRAESYHRSGTQKKIHSYHVFSDLVLEHGLQDTILLTREPGYFTFRSGQRAIDAAGLISRDIYFHGPRERRTSFGELIFSFSPDFVSVGLPHNRFDLVHLEGYLPLATASAQHWLFIRRQTFEHHFDRFYERWLDRSAADSLPQRSPEERFDDINSRWQVQGKPLRSVEGKGTALSSEFLIDFDELIFDFGADSEHTRLQLLVDDRLVLELTGRDAGAEVRRRGWAVYPWRGRQGQLRLVDFDSEGSIHLDRPRAHVYPQSRMIDDFEAERHQDLWQTRWSPTPEPTAGPARRLGVQMAQGRGLAHTQGRDGVLEMHTRPFEVVDDQLVLTAYDWGNSRCGVHLLIDGKRRLSWVGSQTGRAHMVKWNLQPYKGREAVLQIRDGDPDPDIAIGVDSILGIRLDP